MERAQLPPEMRLGCCYNVFDGHELLSWSVRSVRPLASHVVLVLQTTSNFGAPCRPFLRQCVEALKEEGLVDEIVQYSPRAFSGDEKRLLVSPRASPSELGPGVRPEQVGDQFFNELVKRETGRLHCLRAGCTHFMSLDTDECYDSDALVAALRRMADGQYDALLAKMRHFYRLPTQELRPADEENHVLIAAKCAAPLCFRLAGPYPVLLDPTRRLEGVRRLLVCDRQELTMHHYSMVRLDMRSKLHNVSNRANYDTSDLDSFVSAFEAWQPGGAPIHPHPRMRAAARSTETVPNWHGIDFARLCPVCFSPVPTASPGPSDGSGRPSVYCSERCASYHGRVYSLYRQRREEGGDG